MNVRMVLLIAFAIVSAGVTFFLAKTWIDSQRDAIRRQAEATKPETTESVDVLVAKADLPAGLILTRDHVEWHPWPEDGVAKSFLMEGRDKVDDILGAVVRGGVIAGEPIARGRVLHPGDRGFMAAILKKGMRAISIQLNAEASVSGFIKPGDRVDLLLTHTMTPAQADPPKEHDITETIMRDLRVIGIDQVTDDQNGQASVFKTITLEVTPKQAELVTVANSVGALSVVLRSLPREDAKPDEIARKREPRTHSWDSEASRVLPGVGGPRNQIQVIRGVEQQNVSIPLFAGQGGNITVIRQGLTSTAAGETNAGGTVAREIEQ